MFYDLIEVAVALICFVLIRKNFHQYTHSPKHVLIPIILYALFYFVAIYLIGLTEIGNETFTSFATAGIVQGSTWFLIIYALSLVSSEELIFRVFLHDKIHMVVSALVFSGVHWRPGDFPYLMFPFLFVFGLLQSLLFRHTKNFWAICIAHLVALSTLVILYG